MGLSLTPSKRSGVPVFITRGCCTLLEVVVVTTAAAVVVLCCKETLDKGYTRGHRTSP